MIEDGEVTIGDVKYKVPDPPFPRDTPPEQFSESLKQNRKSFANDQDRIRTLIANGKEPNSPDVITAVHNALASAKMINLLVLAIKEKGGKVTYNKNETSLAQYLDKLVRNSCKKRDDKKKNRQAKAMLLLIVVMFALVLYLLKLADS